MKPGHSLMKHYLQFKDLRAEEYAYLFERARIIKQRFKNYERYQPLADRTLAMIFEKASTRTRVSFEAGMYQMGGSVVHLTTGDSQLGRAEPIEDSAPKVTDPREWMKAVVDELNHEEEDGTTLVHLMLDEAFEKAADQGAEGIRFSYEEA